MQVRDGMSSTLLTVGPGHTLRQAAQLMAGRRVGAAVVMDPDGAGPGILTEGDVLHALADGVDPDSELVANRLTADTVTAAPDWSLEQAAAVMVRRNFRHLIIVDGAEIVGVLSMRDIVRCWTQAGATSAVPAA